MIHMLWAYAGNTTTVDIYFLKKFQLEDLPVLITMVQISTLNSVSSSTKPFGLRWWEQTFKTNLLYGVWTLSPDLPRTIIPDVQKKYQNAKKLLNNRGLTAQFLEYSPE